MAGQGGGEAQEAVGLLECGHGPCQVSWEEKEALELFGNLRFRIGASRPRTGMQHMLVHEQICPWGPHPF